LDFGDRGYKKFLGAGVSYTSDRYKPFHGPVVISHYSWWLYCNVTPLINHWPKIRPFGDPL